MPTTGPITSPFINGMTQYYGMQLGGFAGAQVTSLKIYDFTVATSSTLTSTNVSPITQTISGLTTNDVVIGVTPSTGPWANALAGWRVSASSQLELSWMGLSTSAGAAQGKQLATLMTLSYANQSSSTST